MQLKTRGHEGSWKIDPRIDGDLLETSDGTSLNAALWETAGQIASDAGSEALEDPFEWTRTIYRVDIFHRMQHVLRQPGDYWRGPDGYTYILEEDE